MKAFIISGAFLFMAGSVLAQHSNVHVGLKGGLNISNIASSPNAGFDAKAGFHAGGLAHIHLNKQWAIQPEIMYSGQGAQSNDVKTRLHYVNVPVQLQYMFDRGFRIQTGPQLGMLAAANVQQGDVKTNVKSSFKTAELGWTIGASYVGESGLGVDARYNYGITNINDASSVNLYNRNVQVGVFYVFKHKY
ncbi:outer membrane protein with beta-barrel domain [Lacibacter cauensis]|uniref:Outer membrane protein with beta-barrel domain n=1 Tax=Lacibacter cauensis TaxID=510947 RepID=A0A562SW09_9BACT|nr:porin family protein [Lacibacter cauensis]TWI84940.1 outer membrane protein with beta-barrel domain [Lacibacter cauensis]